LWPVLKALCLWGAVQPGHDPRLFISPTALMLSMRATCRREGAGAHRAGFLLAGERFTVETAPGVYRVARGGEGEAMVFEGGTNAMAAAIYGPLPLAESAAGMVRFSGDMAEGQAFVDLFSLRDNRR